MTGRTSLRDPGERLPLQLVGLAFLGTLDGAEAFKLPGVAVVVHFDCDHREWKLWVRASSVFCRDQRSPIEKLGFDVVGL